MKRINDALFCFNAGAAVAAVVLAHMWQMPSLLDAALIFAGSAACFYIAERARCSLTKR